MKKILYPFLLFIAFSGQAQEFNLSGSWKGYLEFGGRKMDIVMSFERQNDQWRGSLSSESQQLKDIAAGNIVLTENQLRFEVPLAGGKWEGTTDKKDQLLGHWLQGSFKAVLNFSRLSEKPELNIEPRVQTPSPPYPYLVEEVTYHNNRDGVKLEATLTIPQGPGPFPAAILLTVAGANDRDQSHGSPQHKPYMVLADYLSKQGIAVLRADDRGIGGSGGELFNSTIEDFAHDALAGFDLLKNDPRIASDKIGFIGNSEGTLVAPLAASINGEAAFIITLGGIGIPGSEVILDQVGALGKISGMETHEMQALRQRTAAMFEVLNTETSSEEVDKKLRQLLNESKSSGSNRQVFLMPQSVDEQLRLFNSPWYRFQINYDPAPVLQQTQCPFLAINGHEDPFVLPDRNLRAIARNLELAGNRQYAIFKLSGLNHVMQDAQSGSPLEYNNNETSFSPRVLELIGTWLKITLQK